MHNEPNVFFVTYIRESQVQLETDFNPHWLSWNTRFHSFLSLQKTHWSLLAIPFLWALDVQGVGKRGTEMGSVSWAHSLGNLNTSRTNWFRPIWLIIQGTGVWFSIPGKWITSSTNWFCCVKLTAWGTGVLVVQQVSMFSGAYVSGNYSNINIS